MRIVRRALPAVPSAGLLAATLLVPWTHFGARVHLGDVRRYHTFAERILDGRVPYHNFFMEYPPGAIPIFLLPELVGRQVGTYGATFQWIAVGMTFLAVVAVAIAIAWLGGTAWRMFAATAFVAVSPALLGAVFFLRFDIWPALLTLLAVLAMLRRRDRTAAAILGIGAATKFYPGLLLPLLAARTAQRYGRRGVAKVVAVFFAAFALLVGPFAVIAFGGVGYSFRTQLTRTLEIESLGGAILLCAHRLGLYHPAVFSGLSFELEGGLPNLLGEAQTVLLAAALLVTWIAFYRSSRSDEQLVLAVAATIAALAALDKVLSPQYLVWLVPVVPLLSRRVGAVACSLLAAAMLLTIAYFPSRFGDLHRLGSSAWIVLARDLVLVGLAFFLVNAVRVESARAKRYDTQPPVSPL